MEHPPLAQANRIAIIFLSTAVICNAVLRYAGAEALMYVIAGATVGMNLLAWLLRSGARPFALVAVAFGVTGVMPQLWSLATLSVPASVAGAVGMFGYFSLWLLVLTSPGFLQNPQSLCGYARLQLVLGAGTAVVAIYQYFVSPDLWGIMPVRPHTALEFIQQGFTKRATGFVGSPQNLGLYMGALCACVFLTGRNPKGWVQVAGWLLFGTAGMLSGSAAFVAFVVIFSAGLYWTDRTALPVHMFRLIVLAGVVWLVVSAQDIENLGNTLFGALYFGSPMEDRVPFYTELIVYDGPYELLFGHGLGTANRVVEVMVGQDATPIAWRQSESHLATVYYEMGIVGFVAFASLYVAALRRALRARSAEGRVLFAMLLALIGNLATTPSFSGLTMAATLWPFILAPLTTLSQGAARLEHRPGLSTVDTARRFQSRAFVSPRRAHLPG